MRLFMITYVAKRLKMGRCLEFALATFIIVIINTTFALWVGNVISNKLRDVVEILIQALSQLN